MMLPEAAFTFQFWTSFIIYYYNRMKQLISPGAVILQAELHQHRSHKRHQNYTGLIYFLLVMNQFRKVVAGSRLGMLLVFSRNLNVSLGGRDKRGPAPRLQSHYPLLVGPDQECLISTPTRLGLLTTISYRLENPGNDGLQAGARSGQEEASAP